MENKFGRAVLAGIIATAVMTGVGLMAPIMGLPKMNPAAMLSGMMGVAISGIYHAFHDRDNFCPGVCLLVQF